EQAIVTSERGEKDFESIQAKLNDEEFDWEAEWGDEENVIGKKIKIHISDMDTTKWREDLTDDLTLLNELLENVREIKGDNDPKFQRLIGLLKSKIDTPINPGNKKVIVFTAFADTANYLYDNIHGYLKERYNINT